MKYLTIITLTLCSIAVKAQQKSKPVDTLTESQVIQISQLLQFGEVAAGNSDKVSTSQYNQYHAAVAKIDSVLGVMYRKWHPVVKPVEKAKKP